MLSSVLNYKKKDFLQHVNEIWKECGDVFYKDFNKMIGKSEVSTIKFISQLTEKMYGERLAAQVNKEGKITGWQFYVKPHGR